MDNRILAKSKVVTLRVKQNTVSALEEEAREKAIPFNALANVIFEEYLEVHQPALKADLIYTPKELLRELLNTIPEENIPLIAANAAYPGLQNVACMMEKGLTFDSVVRVLLSLAKYSGYACSDIITEDGKRTISFVHHLGIRYSALIRACLERASAGLKEHSILQFDISDSRLTLNIERHEDGSKM